MPKRLFSPKSSFYAMRIANVVSVTLTGGLAYVLGKLLGAYGWAVVVFVFVFFMTFHWAFLGWLKRRYFKDD